MTDILNFAQWSRGYGVIRHQARTQAWVKQLINKLNLDEQGQFKIISLLQAADRIANAAMWLVVHAVYATHINLEGMPLTKNDFKMEPQGHVGGSLNMVPAYAGYMLANAISGTTRAWLMGQGHCVAAIDSVNLLLDNMTLEHAKRYDYSPEGLKRYINDFYSYRLTPEGNQDSPLGSHVNIHTAGGILEGGYLGFAELQYMHMPLPGETLVTFLSDGSFEEQRGADWAAHWWRAEDTGLIIPIMIWNGRRIDQRTMLAQQNRLQGFMQHLKNYQFDPVAFDGTDPAAFACIILEHERRLLTQERRYPVKLPYGIAVAEKGAGFYGAGTQAAHNLPLGANPYANESAREHFNTSAQRLFVSVQEVLSARQCLNNHAATRRLRERDHPIANRNVTVQSPPEIPFKILTHTQATYASPMTAIDLLFLEYIAANPALRPRIGNPDELLSNHLQNCLTRLKHRVTTVELDATEAIQGKVITALNEEAVASACLANKAGLNLIVTYEAFAPKMLGAIRQEILWSEHLSACQREPGWISIPLVLTSHTYENGKNERSHQDPTLCEALLGESANISRVLFPADYNSTLAALDACYQTVGNIFTLVVPKSAQIADIFTETEARHLLAHGINRINVAQSAKQPAIILTAIGAYQLQQVMLAARRLQECDITPGINYIIEPGRLRKPRGRREAEIQLPMAERNHYYPPPIQPRVFVSHTRPEIISGILRPLDTGQKTIFLGYTNHGGTLNTAGMLFVNRQSWAHIIQACAQCLEIDPAKLLKPDELAVLKGLMPPQGIII